MLQILANCRVRSRSGATVYVRGKVVQQVPLLDARVYSIEDASGRINIWTQGAMPQIGEEITVRGKLQFKSIAVEGQEIGEVYVEEMERLNS
uniref:Uncharacterized protein n=1 Tax=Desertifilum tharense IPPAS B-1220 TaxID=1781255 RepID=A0ACD5GZQ3_9CYAN